MITIKSTEKQHLHTRNKRKKILKKTLQITFHLYKVESGQMNKMDLVKF